ncbi:MAG: MFS transporter [Pseudomonadales bacterium]
MLGLILAGEAIYALPFHLTRFFRPTLLEVFGLSATELGAAQSVYGVVAMLAYFPGGPLADRFPARKLMAMSLWTTAGGGLYLATFPGYTGSLLVWGFFGVTTILLFWAALIRATRDWGGQRTQGQAYGILDGGRGLLAAGMASIGVLIFDLAFPDGYNQSSPAERAAALQTVIYGYTGVTALAGVFVWFALKDPGTDQPATTATHVAPVTASISRNILIVLRLPAVWLQAIIVACAYVGYKGVDNFTLFAVDAYGLDPVEAAEVVAIGAWMRPIAALGAGLIGDRYSIPRMLVISFVILTASNLFFALDTPTEGAVLILLINVLVTCIAVFALRGLYFAVFEDAKVPLGLTGTAVGLVSVVGYTPDVFTYLVAGILIDRSPGLAGHQDFFLFLTAFAVIGTLASLAFVRLVQHNTAVSTATPATSK